MYLVEGGVSLPGGYFKRNILIEIDNIWEFRNKYKNTGVYITAFAYSNPDQYNCLLDGNMYYDFDGENNFEEVREDALLSINFLTKKLSIPSDNINLYFSGKKGLHMTIDRSTLGLLPSYSLHQSYRGIAQATKEYCKNGTLDMKIYERRRLFRCVNSVHNSSGLYKIPIAIEELKSLSIDEIKDLAKQMRLIYREPTIQTKKCKAAVRELISDFEKPKSLKWSSKKQNQLISSPPPCIQKIINGKISEGNRNNCALILASFYAQNGVSKDECLRAIDNWNLELDSSLPQMEIDMAVDHVYQRKYKIGCQSIRGVIDCDKDSCMFQK